jgi:anthranilate phosphoribosyltransferase
MNISEAIEAMVTSQDLTSTQMESVMEQIMTGVATPAQIGSFLVGLRMKGETVDEISSAARVMRKLSLQISVKLPYMIDTCGTGGDASQTFNISTAAAFVAAAAGCHVAKHGNRSVSSKSGSADLLEMAGTRLNMTPDEVSSSLAATGIGFLFAPLHHSAMRHAVGPRREMGIRTIFNLLGPLTNPAQVPHQILGVYHRKWIRPIAETLQKLGLKSAMVVHGADGLDEITISDETWVCELNHGTIQEYRITPEQFGFQRRSLDTIRVPSARESLTLIERVFEGEASPASDIIALNAGASIYIVGLTQSLSEGVERAKTLIASGAVKSKMEEYIRFNQGDRS